MPMIPWSQLPAYIDPVLVQIGPLSIRYYGICFLASIMVTYFLILKHPVIRERLPTPDSRESLLFYSLIGICLGGRLGYVLFYQFDYFMSHPLEIFLPLTFDNGVKWSGISGMSYHGGLLGFVTALVMFCRQYHVPVLKLGDVLAYYIPLGYFFGRLGNFLNGELWGRMTHVAWGMYFPSDPLQVKRHPSQLYEAIGEGIILFLVLRMLKQVKHWHDGAIAAFYMTGYGLIRFVLEYFREPDAELGFIFKLTMGQWLCVSMMFAGGIFFFMTKYGAAKA